jgi:hypothetical protein
MAHWVRIQGSTIHFCCIQGSQKNVTICPAISFELCLEIANPIRNAHDSIKNPQPKHDSAFGNEDDAVQQIVGL